LLSASSASSWVIGGGGESALPSVSVSVGGGAGEALGEIEISVGMPLPSFFLFAFGSWLSAVFALSFTAPSALFFFPESKFCDFSVASEELELDELEEEELLL